jgi:hypothetical protein
MQYNYTAQDAADYVDSLDPILQSKLSDESMETLENQRVLTLNPNENLYHFDNGYAFMYWFNRSKNSYSYDVYLTEDLQGSYLEGRDGLMQVQCWLAAHEVMARNTYIEPNVSEKMIAEIRAKCNNPDDLQKIKSAVESMLEALN